MTSSIKENWEKVDKLCPTCNQVTEKAKGITKQSMKRLFSFNWKDPNEWVWIAVIVFVCLMAWSYKHDMATYNDFMQNRVEYCTQILSEEVSYGNGEGLELDLNGLDIKKLHSPWNTQ